MVWMLLSKIMLVMLTPPGRKLAALCTAEDSELMRSSFSGCARLELADGFEATMFWRA